MGSQVLLQNMSSTRVLSDVSPQKLADIVSGAEVGVLCQIREPFTLPTSENLIKCVATGDLIKLKLQDDDMVDECVVFFPIDT